MSLIVGTAGLVSCLTAMRLAIRGSEVPVPNVEGQSIQDAGRRISASELHLKIDSRRFDPLIPAEKIISQDPSPDSKLKKNRSVRVVVSLGAKRVQVPDLHGESLRVGQIALLKSGLSLGMIATVSSEALERDKIISQDPVSQTSEAQTSLVNVLVSSGKRSEEYLMPDLLGKNLDEVSKPCERLGIHLGKVIYQPATSLVRGTVIKQNPPPGHKLATGDSIDLEVSK